MSQNCIVKHEKKILLSIMWVRKINGVMNDQHACEEERLKTLLLIFIFWYDHIFYLETLISTEHLNAHNEVQGREIKEVGSYIYIFNDVYVIRLYMIKICISFILLLWPTLSLELLANCRYGWKMVQNIGAQVHCGHL